MHRLAVIVLVVQRQVTDVDERKRKVVGCDLDQCVREFFVE
jgi:hypothetical protein